jgi:hypothetical protein
MQQQQQQRQNQKTLKMCLSRMVHVRHEQGLVR